MPFLLVAIVLIVLGYILPALSILATIGYILLVVGLILLLLRVCGRPLYGRGRWYV